MVSDSFKLQLNTYVDSLISNSFKEREIRDSFSKPNASLYDIFVEQSVSKNTPVHKHESLNLKRDNKMT